MNVADVSGLPPNAYGLSGLPYGKDDTYYVVGERHSSLKKTYPSLQFAKNKRNANVIVSSRNRRDLRRKNPKKIILSPTDFFKFADGYYQIPASTSGMRSLYNAEGLAPKVLSRDNETLEMVMDVQNFSSQFDRFQRYSKAFGEAMTQREDVRNMLLHEWDALVDRIARSLYELDRIRKLNEARLFNDTGQEKSMFWSAIDFVSGQAKKLLETFISTPENRKFVSHEVSRLGSMVRMCESFLQLYNGHIATETDSLDFVKLLKEPIPNLNTKNPDEIVLSIKHNILGVQATDDYDVKYQTTYERVYHLLEAIHKYLDYYMVGWILNENSSYQSKLRELESVPNKDPDQTYLVFCRLKQYDDAAKGRGAKLGTKKYYRIKPEKEEVEFLSDVFSSVEAMRNIFQSNIAPEDESYKNAIFDGKKDIVDANNKKREELRWLLQVELSNAGEHRSSIVERYKANQATICDLLFPITRAATLINELQIGNEPTDQNVNAFDRIFHDATTDTSVISWRAMFTLGTTPVETDAYVARIWSKWVERKMRELLKVVHEKAKN